MWAKGQRGHIFVVADAMRKELYPALFECTDAGLKRLTADRVAKASEIADEAAKLSKKFSDLIISGDGLTKYKELFFEQNVASDEL